MIEETINNINFQIEQINKLFHNYDELISKSKIKELNFIEITALGSCLHSFYNGLENIFEIIASEIDNEKINGENYLI